MRSIGLLRHQPAFGHCINYGANVATRTLSVFNLRHYGKCPPKVPPSNETECVEILDKCFGKDPLNKSICETVDYEALDKKKKFNKKDLEKAKKPPPKVKPRKCEQSVVVNPPYECQMSQSCLVSTVMGMFDTHYECCCTESPLEGLTLMMRGFDPWTPIPSYPPDGRKSPRKCPRTKVTIWKPCCPYRARESWDKCPDIPCKFQPMKKYR